MGEVVHLSLWFDKWQVYNGVGQRGGTDTVTILLFGLVFALVFYIIIVIPIKIVIMALKLFR